ncbi:hypothetical protein K469DRAFT_710130 [Zopfia rhizophila CBS 207.26]|uniref:Uncharacterized protein n=1 Tax=Zopfia rhizophila CBS 207.26 TaxID=1314779 RepID=A0A6A6E158_9PEZI|nr:hypothetical protein K469DRAFT_710130 [Zopfia rhizophila CBS 207.26]
MSSKRGTFGLVIGGLFGVSSIVLWTLYVNRIVKTAHVSEGVNHWVNLARDEAYGLCYDGCSDCLDVESIGKACRMTASVNISGVVCNASKMWTWADRYPLECLIAVGEIFKADALWWKRFWLRALYLLNVGSVLFFVLGCWVAEGTLAVCDSFNLAKPRLVQRRRSNSRTPLLNPGVILLLAIAFLPPVAAYRCMYMNPAQNQLFANADDSLYGVIHGWLSDCYDGTYSCGESCSTSDGKSTCGAIWCSQPRINRPPSYYVNSAARRVQNCDFRLVDAVPGMVDKRIANPRIEGRLWVKVSVNRFNGSEGVLQQVQCLYDMINIPGLMEL